MCNMHAVVFALMAVYVCVCVCNMHAVVLALMAVYVCV